MDHSAFIDLLAKDEVTSLELADNLGFSHDFLFDAIGTLKPIIERITGKEITQRYCTGEQQQCYILNAGEILLIKGFLIISTFNFGTSGLNGNQPAPESPEIEHPEPEPEQTPITKTYPIVHCFEHSVYGQIHAVVTSDGRHLVKLVDCAKSLGFRSWNDIVKHAQSKDILHLIELDDGHRGSYFVSVVDLPKTSLGRSRKMKQLIEFLRNEFSKLAPK